MSGRLGERGSVTAEFAVALPAVALLLGGAVWALGVAAAQVLLQDETGVAARAAARGEPIDAGTVEHAGELVCVSRTRSLPPLTLTARACALP